LEQFPGCLLKTLALPVGAFPHPRRNPEAALSLPYFGIIPNDFRASPRPLKPRATGLKQSSPLCTLWFSLTASRPFCRFILVDCLPRKSGLPASQGENPPGLHLVAHPIFFLRLNVSEYGSIMRFQRINP